MSLLCIDVGNTRTKAAVTVGAGFRELPSVATADLVANPQQIGEWRKLAGDATRISWCSVVPRASKVVAGYLGGRPEVDARQLTVDRLALPIRYPQAREIGGDRLAVSLGAWTQPGPPCIIVDMGTATTLDILSVDGYEGGIIAPGLEVMTRYLHEQTALLPQLDPEDLLGARGIGRSTREAMRIGCSIGFGGMIRALLETVSAELTERGVTGEIPVLATGGAVGSLLKPWAGRIQIREHLIFEGLREAFEPSRR
jgi:type III pantothenate kinase